MPNNDEKARRKELLHSLRDEERRKQRESFPAPMLLLKGLFDFLDLRLSENGCDDTLTFTREYIRQSAMNEDETIRGLAQQGGFCDCEVLNNVESLVADAVPGYEQISGETGSVN